MIHLTDGSRLIAFGPDDPSVDIPSNEKTETPTGFPLFLSPAGRETSP